MQGIINLKFDGVIIRRNKMLLKIEESSTKALCYILTSRQAYLETDTAKSDIRGTIISNYAMFIR